MNSINMLDNMDGITTVTTIFILITTLFFIGFQNGFENFDFMVIIGVLASLISFLFYNWTQQKFIWVILEVNFLVFWLQFLVLNIFGIPQFT